MKFDELSDEAKKKALDNVRSVAHEFFNGDYVIEDWKEILKACGFSAVTIMYSGFYSQGDGACFTGGWQPDWVEPDKLDEYSDKLKLLFDYPLAEHAKYKLCLAAGVDPHEPEDGETSSMVAGHAKLEHRGRYYHEKNVSYEYSYEGWNRILEEDFEDWCEDLMREIYRCIRDEYEYQMSDEGVMELIECNDYDFNDKGEQQ